MALKGGGRPEPSRLFLGLLLCGKSLSNHYEACVDTVMGHRSIHLHIIILVNEVAVNSRLVCHFAAMKWSIGCGRSLKSSVEALGYQCCLSCKKGSSVIARGGQEVISSSKAPV